METSATVRLIEGVRLIRCPLNTGFTVYRNPKLGLACSRFRGQVSLFTSGWLELFKEAPNDVTYTLMDLENIF